MQPCPRTVEPPDCSQRVAIIARDDNHDAAGTDLTQRYRVAGYRMRSNVNVILPPQALLVEKSRRRRHDVTCHHSTEMPNCRIENKDSKEYNLTGKVSGSSAKVCIPNSTSTVTWQGSGDFILDSGSAVSFPGGKIEGGKNYKVSGGKAS